jgi:glycosyltransferase involved in cell wall biosynthesis
MSLPETHAKLLAELEGFEHLLFEPMTQADLDRLHALSERWLAELGDSPEAIILCDALDDFIAAGIEVLTSGRRLMSRFLVSADGRLNAGFYQQRLEAMSLGCAIVASDTQPLHEAIQHDETGRLVDFFDTARLIDAICDLLDDPTTRQRLGANARAFAQATYDLKRICLPQQLDWVERLA